MRGNMEISRNTIYLEVAFKLATLLLVHLFFDLIQKVHSVLDLV